MGLGLVVATVACVESGNYFIADSKPMGNEYVRTVLEGYGSGGRGYEFSLKTGPLSSVPADELAADHLWGWGPPDSPERELLPTRAHVLELNLSLDGKKVDIPRQAVFDLIELRPDFEKGPIKREGADTYLYFNGADAGESYLARFTVRDGRLTQRDVWHAEFPEAGPRTTKYGR